MLVETQIPTGEIGKLNKGDPLDFSTPKLIGKQLNDTLGVCGTGQSSFFTVTLEVHI